MRFANELNINAESRCGKRITQQDRLTGCILSFDNFIVFGNCIGT